METSAASNSKRGSVALLLGGSLVLLQMNRTVTTLPTMEMRYMTAPYARSEASPKTCTSQSWRLGFRASIHRGTCNSDKRCNSDVHASHFTAISGGSVSSHASPLVHVSWKSIFPTIATG